jgi:hypothetical protein
MEDDEPLRLRVEAELREQGLSVAIDPASIGRIAALLGAQDWRKREGDWWGCLLVAAAALGGYAMAAGRGVREVSKAWDLDHRRLRRCPRPFVNDQGNGRAWAMAISLLYLEGPVSLKRCQFGERLPPNVTCAAVCSVFPECKPPPSPELLSVARRFWAEGQAESENDQAVASTLEQLYEAITQGLERRE